MAEPKIYSTAEWGARPPNKGGQPRKAAAGIIVHNTEHENRAPLTGEAEQRAAFGIARSIQSDHLKRKTSSGTLWADTGQHFTISRGGIIMEGRHGSLAAAKNGLVVSGAHANSTRHNQTWFGIELEGHYVRAFDMTDEQWESLVELSAWLAHWGNFDGGSILGHKEVSDTDCPGLVVDHLDDLRARVRQRKEQLAREHG